MLSNSLNTNEIKNAAGTEVEFSRLSTADRSTVYAQINEQPNLPHRLMVSHQESGALLKRRRRSVVRFDKTVISGVDSATPVTISAYAVVDIPSGALTATTEVANTLAELMSFLASDGSGTTILYAGTGNGATTLINGSL